MIDFTPDPIALQVGPISLYWYGIGYALGLAVGAWVMTREARRRGLDAGLIPNGLIVVALAALVGGRVYHVIDQWQLYKDDLSKIVLPPYTGLGAYGGLIAGTIALFAYTRYKKIPFWTWGDVAAPAVFLMQGIARWGNFFNQELYGPPTNLPWGIAIQCVHRIADYACPPGSDPTATLGEHFQPLFLYESISGIAGALALLFVARRFATRLRPGDLVLIFFIWYGLVRFALETLRTDNWTFLGVPVAQIVSLGFVLGSLVVLVYRHRPGAVRPPAVTADDAGPGSEAGPGESSTPARSDEPADALVPADVLAQNAPSGSTMAPPP
jgi:phosphatidylglycerol:prolipoprotein diacylglycerol transferase